MRVLTHGEVRELSRQLDASLPDVQWAFIAFDGNALERAQFASSIDVPTFIAALEEMVKHMKEGQHANNSKKILSVV